MKNIAAFGRENELSNIMGTIALLALLSTALATDLKSRKIPNMLTLPFIPAGILFHALESGGLSAEAAVWGAAAGFLPMILLYVLGGIGAGDVKLFGAAGAWIGAGMVLQLMMISILYAGLIGVLLLVLRRLPFERLRRFVGYFMSADPEAAETGNTGAESAEESNSRPKRAAKARLKMPFMIAVIPAVVTIWPAFPN